MAFSFSKRVTGTTPYYNLIKKVAFPSIESIALTSIIVTTVGIGGAFLITGRSFLVGALSGIAILVVPAFALDFVLHATIMKHDPLFYLRRCFALSLFTFVVWVLVFWVGAFLTYLVPSFLFPDFAVIIALFLVLPVRSVALFSMSRVNFSGRTLFTVLEPAVASALAVLVFKISPARTATGLVLAILAGLLFAFVLISVIEAYGLRVIGISPIRMFRAFLADWLEGKNQELEAHLAELGVQAEIDLAAFVFREKEDHRVKGTILVSNFHAGPFLNVGSSVLPFLFHEVMRRRYGAVGFAPHGVSGHELNLVSQEQNTRVISWLTARIGSVEYDGKASKVIRARNEKATATSQVFDQCALVTMTTSPSDMEDVPAELASRIIGLTQGKFRHVALVDAHNCLTRPTTMSPDKVGALEEAAMSTLQDVSESPRHDFKVGAAAAPLPQFGLKDGIGPGGIGVIAIEADGQCFAYICIDGNNMVRGLREEILAVALSVGFSDGEVLTTDTHMVNGVVSAPLGYYLVGEAIPKERLLSAVNLVCQNAIRDLSPAEVAVVSGQIPVTTLGTKSLRRVMTVVYRISKLTALTLFPLIALLASISLLLLV